MKNKEDFIAEINEIINEYLYKPLFPAQLKELVNVEPEEEQPYIEAIKSMEDNGDLFYTGKGKCVPPGMIGLVTGIFQKSSRDFGFVIVNNSDERDIFIHKTKINGAMNRDSVAVKITSKAKFGSRPEGEIVKIIKRYADKSVCTFFKKKTHAVAVPIDRKAEEFIIKPEDSMNALDGDKVVVDVSNGKIIEIIGHKGDKGINVLSLLREQGFVSEFREEVLKEAEAIPEFVEEKSFKGRTDLREEIIFTIDGNDTKDIDDAVSIVKLNDEIYRLGVHIADVSHYVKEGSPLDKSAYERATSVYPVDRVSPMLPPALSNGICSLNPNVDRLALSVTMDIDKNGTVVNHDVFKSIIHSKEQMTYTNVYKILEENDSELCDRYSHIVPALRLMKELALILRKKRFDRGAIDFDIPEPKVILDDKDIPAEIVKREITIANILIEEMMLACNETVSQHFYWLDIPFVYRVHDEPNEEKIERFCEFVSVMGYKLKNSNNIHSRELQNLLSKVKGKNEERIISTIMLRAMQKAKYTNQHGGHFGLAAEYYSHFTSPIRRYPDLMIHRIISECLAGKMNENRISHYNSILGEVTNHCSERERAAETVERESVKLKMAEYMKNHVGETFPCIISGVAGFGMFVETENLIEGLVPMDNLYDDYYIYNENQYALIGERTNKKYQIGDRVTAIVVRADVNARTIEFALDLQYNS